MLVPSCVPNEPRTKFDYVVALIPLCSTVLTAFIAAYVALVSRRQAKTADRKLSLDLYDRRLQIYMRTVDFVQALPTWQMIEDKKGLHDRFIRAQLESTFLFPKFTVGKSVRQRLDKMGNHALDVTKFFEHGQSMAPANPIEYEACRQKKDEALESILKEFVELQNEMVRSMRFHERMSPS